MRLCPFCDEELLDSQRSGDGWNCRCGEFVPLSMAASSADKKCDCDKCRGRVKKSGNGDK